MDIAFLKPESSMSSLGVLPKAWYKIDNRICLVKGASFHEGQPDGREPLAEVMASRIAEVLELDHISYRLLDAGLFPELNWGYPYVSVCENYLKTGESFITADAILSRYGDSKETDWFKYLDDCLDLKIYTDMFIFDAFIGNRDRHLRNFGKIYKDGEALKNFPIFDNGASLLSSHSLGHSDQAKPIRNTHKQQLQLLPRRRFDIDFSTIVQALGDTLDILPRVSRQRLLEFLEERMCYLNATY